MLVLSVCYALAATVTVTGYGTLGYSCAFASEQKIEKVGKKKKRWQELCWWRSHFLFSYLISKLLGYTDCLSTPVTYGKECSWGESKDWEFKFLYSVPRSTQGSPVTCDKSVKHWNLNFPICEMDIKGANLLSVTCLIFFWEPACSSDLEKTWHCGVGWPHFYFWL